MLYSGSVWTNNFEKRLKLLYPTVFYDLGFMTISALQTYQSMNLNTLNQWLTILVPTQQIGQTHSKIRRLLSTNVLSVFDHFVGFALKGLRCRFKSFRANNPIYFNLLQKTLTFSGGIEMRYRFKWFFVEKTFSDKTENNKYKIKKISRNYLH